MKSTLRFTLALIAVILAAVHITPPAAASAPPADISVSITCAYGPDDDVYLPAGVSTVTINNDNNCNSSGTYPSASLAYGDGATFTYSKTINSLTSSGNYAVFNGNFETGQLAPGDSFSLTQVSSLGRSVRFYFGNRPSIYVHFYAPIFDSTATPITIGSATTLTGSNLLGVTGIGFYQGPGMGIRFFVTPTSNSSTSVTFTMPTSYVGFFGPGGDVPIGTYSITPFTPDITGTTQTGSVIAAPPARAEADPAAVAAAVAAKREAEKQSARAEIVARYKDSKLVEVELFSKAEIAGISTANINQINAEVLGFSEVTRSNLAVILKVSRKYEVVGRIASDQAHRVYSNLYIEIGLIPAGSKNKVELVAAVRRLSLEDRNTYSSIKSAVDAEMARIQIRTDRLAAVIARISGRSEK
jgi:hypothetical protein